MSAHEQFEEDLALYAMGSLEGNDLVALKTHLQGCADCRRELELLRGDMALLAMSTTGPAPPRRSRQRLVDAIAREPRNISVPAPHNRFWDLFPWIASAAAAIMIVLLLHENSRLYSSLSTLQILLNDQHTQLEQAKDILTTFTSPESQQITLVAAKTPPQPQGKTFYLRSKGSLVFLANNMPVLPPQKAYELWLIPTNGSPIPAGLFKPNAHGSATIVNPPLSAGIEAKAFAITVEPEAGSTAPTSTPIMLGAGE